MVMISIAVLKAFVPTLAFEPCAWALLAFLASASLLAPALFSISLRPFSSTDLSSSPTGTAVRLEGTADLVATAFLVSPTYL